MHELASHSSGGPQAPGPSPRVPCTASNAITIASTLRAYLRYRATRGDAVQPLLAVIASLAHWSMASRTK